MTNDTAATLEVYKECFYNLSEQNCIFYKILDVLEVIANSKNCIGEVVQDYAIQTCGQLKAIITAGTHVVNSSQSEEDIRVLHNANYVMKTINRFFELLPAAMRRNNADCIGNKEKFSVQDIEKIAYVFSHSSQVQLLQVVHEADASWPVQANM